MKTKKTIALTTLAMCTSLMMATATGLAANKPSQATPITLGVTYFGDSRSSSGSSAPPYGSVWRLPPLLAQDVVTIAGTGTGGDEVPVGIAGDVDDFDYVQEWNNNFEPVGDSSTWLPPQSARLTLRVIRACSACFLELGSQSVSWYNDPYSFAVESIQHAVGLGLTSVSSVNRKGTLRGTAYLSNGAPVPDGFDVALIVRKGSKKWVRVGRTTAGRVTFGLRLPKSAKGKVRVSLSRGADTEYLAANTRSFKARIT